METKLRVLPISGGINNKFVQLINHGKERTKTTNLTTIIYLKQNNFLKFKSLRNNPILALTFLENLFSEEEKVTPFISKTILGKNYKIIKKLKPLGIQIK